MVAVRLFFICLRPTEIEGKVSISELTRIPVGRVKVGAPNPCHSFECFISELNPIARCHFYLLVNLN
ncbi:hypothetical protein ACU6ZW_07210 [Klebsiella aerogenes]|nr:hypothetical protein [Klebsiella aerogenes]